MGGFAHGQGQDRSTFFTDQGAFSPRKCSDSAVSFMLKLKILKHWLVAQHGKFPSEFDEEPNFEAIHFNGIHGFAFLKNSREEWLSQYYWSSIEEVQDFATQ
jgi:hypothetical protein